MYWRLVPVAMACLLTSCWTPVETCELDLGPRIVRGVWKISGSGRRTHCSDRNYNGKFELNSETTLDVTQTEGTLGGYDDLSLLNNPAENQTFAFKFDGEVNGKCVAFHTIEVDTAVAQNNVRFNFDGVAMGGQIIGDFVTFGPGECEGEGTFLVDID